MKAKLALLEANPSTSETPKTFQPKNKGLVAETFYWDEEEVLDDEEVTQVKVLMALANDELTVGKNHARNGEWIDITMRKVNILLSMDEDVDWQNLLKYINIYLKFVEEQILNLLSKYNKIVFELNKCRDELLVLKETSQALMLSVSIQNTKLTKLNHALQEQLKEEKKINEKWQTSSKKVRQCISEQIPHQKKKVLGGEMHTKASSKMNEHENLFVHASMGFDHEMGASPSSEVSLNKSVSGTITVSEIEPITPSVTTEVKNTEQESKINELTTLVQMLIDEKETRFQDINHINFFDNDYSKIPNADERVEPEHVRDDNFSPHLGSNVEPASEFFNNVNENSHLHSSDNISTSEDEEIATLYKK
ncbi:hypothetical protein Tco_0321156 [Tanacetum coccineum]